MKVTQIQEDNLRRVIRDARAIDPLISLRSLQRIVEEKTNRTIGINYVMKLVKKVDGDIKVRPDLERIEKRVAEMRENNRIVREGLLKIAYPGPNAMPAKDSDRIKALETIAKIDHSQAKIEMDFGIYTKKPGENDGGKGNIDTEKLQSIVKAFENWGISPPQMRKIEAVRIVTVKSTIITNEQPHQPTAPNTGSKVIPAVNGAGLVPTE